MIIISVVGQPASGKDTVADYIATKGFAEYSSADFIRRDMDKVGIETTRSNMQVFSADMRKKVGNGYPAMYMTENIQGDTVISGFRNTAEVEVFKEKFGDQYKIIAVEAPIETRYKWASDRKRIGDNISFEEFKKEEDNEKANNTGSHEVDKVIGMADIKLINDGTLEDLYGKIDEVLKYIK